MKRHSAILFAAISATGAALADTPDVTLRVPIQIQNLDERILGAIVRCKVHVKRRDGTEKWQEVPSKGLSIDTVTGNVVEQEIEVPVVVDRNVTDPRDISNYRCGLYVMTNATKNTLDPRNSNDKYVHTGTVPVDVPKEGGGSARISVNVNDPTKPLTDSVSGSIP